MALVAATATPFGILGSSPRLPTSRWACGMTSTPWIPVKGLAPSAVRPPSATVLLGCGAAVALAIGRPSSLPTPATGLLCDEVVPPTGWPEIPLPAWVFAGGTIDWNALRTAHFAGGLRCKKVTFTATPADRATKAHTAATRRGVMASPQRARSSWPQRPGPNNGLAGVNDALTERVWVFCSPLEPTPSQPVVQNSVRDHGR